MPPVAVAAGIGAVGAIGGAVVSSNAAKSAARTQADSAAQQIAYLRENRDYITGLSRPTIDRGNAAGSLIGGFLGLEGGDKAAAALQTYRDSTGYQDLLDTGLGAVRSNAYARGLGASGATLKALQSRGMALADQSAGSWLNGLGSLAQMGNSAIGNVAGVATQTTGAINNALQTSANANSNAALAQGGAWNNAFQQLGNLGGTLVGGGNRSSYTSWYNPGG
jgi:hypothetical protein